jgi:fibronectin type 3 domain-containing protein
MKGDMMKKFKYLPIIFTLIVFYINAYAETYEYSLKSILGNTAQTTNSHGNAPFGLKMTLWLNDTHTITAKFERKDGYAFESVGYLYLQTNSEESNELQRIDCGNDHAVTDDFSQTMTSTLTLDDITATWSDDELLIYGRYENGNQYAWTGPITIIRKRSEASGSLKVELYTSSAVDAGAAWSYEIPDSQSGWSPWINSDEPFDNLSVGPLNIRFKPVSGWETPDNQKVIIKNGDITKTEGIYLSQKRSLLVMIYPEQARSAGAKWKAIYPGVGESVWYPGNIPVENFKVGETTVSFKSIEGWKTPEEQKIEIKSDQSTIIEATYCKDKPYSPVDLVASQGEFTDRLVLKWKAVSCVNRYEIFRSTKSIPSSNDRIASNISGTQYIDTNSDPGREYYYWVRAVNEKGPGEFSNYVIGYTNLKQPENVNATDGFYLGKVRIEWDSVPGASSYRIYRNTDSNFNSAECIAKDIEKTVYDDNDGIPELEYYYWVKAENSIMTSAFSQPDKGLSRLGAPENLNASDEAFVGKVKICWSPVKGASSYEYDFVLEKRTRKNNIREQADECYFHEGAIPGKTYYYRVRSKNHYGVSNWTNFEAGSSIMATPVIHASKRTKPDRISITWIPVEGATRYYIYKSEINRFSSAIKIGTSIGREYEFLTTEKREFYFWVKAVNEYCSSLSDSDKGYISDGCSFSISPKDLTVDAETGIGSVAVNIETHQSCLWHAESNVGWISILSGESGNESGEVTFQASENKSSASRTAILTIAGEAVHVEQIGMSQITLNAISTEGGKLLINDKEYSGTYTEDVDKGELVTIEAVPYDNWHFTHFSGSGVDTTNPLTIEIKSNTTITAHYTRTRACLNVTIVGKGQIFIDDDETDQKCVPQGSMLNLRAANDQSSAYFFTNWSGDYESNDSKIKVLMDTDKNITALFDGWSVDIHAEGVYLGGYHLSKVSLGVSSEAFQNEAPPAPPRYSSMMRLKFDNKYVNTDIRLDRQESYQWRLSVDPHGNMGPPQEPQSTILYWDKESLPKVGTCQLLDGYDLEKTTILISDMRETTEYTVTGLSGEQFFSVVWTPPDDDDDDQEQPLSPITMSLLCESENFGGTYKVNSTIGIDRLSKRTSSPPAPPVYSTAMSIISDDGKYLTVDVKEIGKQSYEWLIAITPAGNAVPIGSESTVNLSWELSNESYEGAFQLVKLIPKDGEFVVDEIVVQDMSTISNTDISGNSSPQFFKIICKKECPDCKVCEHQFELNEGWNLLSFPYLPDNNIVKYVIPNVDVVYQYLNGEYKEIAKTDSLETDVGYWALMPSEASFKVQGICNKTYSKSLSKGWHLLGCIGQQTMPETTVENSIEVMYEYIDGSYEIVTDCHPGYGFWINMLEDAKLTLESNEQE